MKLKSIRLLLLSTAVVVLVGCGGSVAETDIEATIKNIKPYLIQDRVVKVELRFDGANIIVHAGKGYSRCME